MTTLFRCRLPSQMLRILAVCAVITVAMAADPCRTGLVEETPVGRSRLDGLAPKVKAVRWNQTGLERINRERVAKGLRTLNPVEAGVADDEAVLVDGSTTAVVLGATPPASVDNVGGSFSPFFPPIRSQGSLASCVSFGLVYYALTYEFAKLNNWTVSGGDTSRIFSPKWSYNAVNRGVDGGSTVSDTLYALRTSGACTWAAFPYDANATAWCLDAATWKDALAWRKVTPYAIAGVDTAAGLVAMKTALANGHVLPFATYVTSWRQTTLKNDPATTLDDACVGQYVCPFLDGSVGGHLMTIVGYDDSLWCDLDGDNVVDAGEKGAFRVANSWGAGDWNGGYRWIAYDAFLKTSAVIPAQPGRREACLTASSCYYLTVANHAPKLYARIAARHAKRSQMGLLFGVNNVGSGDIASHVIPGNLSYAGGWKAFNGGVAAVDGVFYADLSDLAPAEATAKRFFIWATDATAGDPLTISSLQLETPAGRVVPFPSIAATDNVITKAWVDWTYTAQPYDPPPVITAMTVTPEVGVFPFTATCSATATDPAGQPVTYAWNFGDGTTGTGASVQHTYAKAGTFTVTLTVDDGHVNPVSATRIVKAFAAATPKVSLGASDGSLAEPANAGRFSVTASPVVGVDTVVTVVVGSASTAVRNTDYQARCGGADLGTTVTIPAGQASAVVDILPIDDLVNEGRETVVLTLQAGTGYTLGTSSVTINLYDDERPEVALTASDNTGFEWNGTAGDSGAFTATCTPPPPVGQPLTVPLVRSGSATAGVDYVGALPTALVFTSTAQTVGGNALTIAVPVTVVDDTLVEGPETVSLALVASATNAYKAVSTGTVTVTIHDDEKPTIGVSASDGSAKEPGTDVGKFKLTRLPVTNQPLTLSLAYAGTATTGADYSIPAAQATSATFAANVGTVEWTITPLDDGETELSETIVLNQITAAPPIHLSASSATITLSDNDLRPADAVAFTDTGVLWSQYRDTAHVWTVLPDFGLLTAEATGTAATPTVSVTPLVDWFGLRFTGCLVVPADGQYTIFVKSDDGSRLKIGDLALVNNDGLHGSREVGGVLGLKAGLHRFTLDYFQAGGGKLLEVRWQGPGISKALLPAANLVHEVPGGSG